MPKKELLTHAERSKIAKERWAKIKASEAEKKADAEKTIIESYKELLETPKQEIEVDSPLDHHETKTYKDGTVATGVSPLPDQSPKEQAASTPVPAPVAPKKPKRPPVPKEFLVALKTADKRLAEAIEEYEDCQRKIAYLEGAIPRLQRTVLALRNESNPDAPVSPSTSYSITGAVQQYPVNPGFQSVGIPYSSQPNSLGAIQAAIPQPPQTRALGNAIQLSPDVFGAMEGPEDDDNEDRFLTGPMAGNKGWIGG